MMAEKRGALRLDDFAGRLAGEKARLLASLPLGHWRKR
jgi:hypothetical protein